MSSKHLILILAFAIPMYCFSCPAAPNHSDERTIVPDTTGTHYFMYSDTVSTRDYMAVVQQINRTFQEHKSLKLSDAIAVMPRSKMEFFPFYFSLTGEGAYYRQYKELIDYAYHLVWKYAFKAFDNEENRACYYVVLNLYRLPPAPCFFITDEYYGDILDGLQGLLYDGLEYYFLCLYSTFNDSLKQLYLEWYEFCTH